MIATFVVTLFVGALAPIILFLALLPLASGIRTAGGGLVAVGALLLGLPVWGISDIAHAQSGSRGDGRADRDHRTPTMAKFVLYRGSTRIFEFDVNRSDPDGFLEIRGNAHRDMVGKASLNGSVATSASFEFRIVRSSDGKTVIAWNDGGEGVGKVTTFYDFRANGWEELGRVTLNPPITTPGKRGEQPQSKPSRALIRYGGL